MTAAATRGTFMMRRPSLDDRRPNNCDTNGERRTMLRMASGRWLLLLVVVVVAGCSRKSGGSSNDVVLATAGSSLSDRAVPVLAIDGANVYFVDGYRGDSKLVRVAKAGGKSESVAKI